MIVEVCANSLQSAQNAQEAGADRLEVCIELGLGGITPSYGLLKELKKRINIPMHVLVRPRSGDFTYSDSEFDSMLWDIDICRDLGYEGIVSGVLNSDYSLDIDRTAQLVKKSEGLQFTFHRAFDWVKDPLKTLQALESIGLNSLLTSGQAKTAVEGMNLLKILLEESVNISVIPAAGIRPNNVMMFKDSGFKAIHLSGVKMMRTLSEKPPIEMNSNALLKEDALAVSDGQLIKELIKTVK